MTIDERLHRYEYFIVERLLKCMKRLKLRCNEQQVIRAKLTHIRLHKTRFATLVRFKLVINIGDPDFKVSSSVLTRFIWKFIILWTNNNICSHWQNVQYTVVNVFLHIIFKVTKSAIMNIF